MLGQGNTQALDQSSVTPASELDALYEYEKVQDELNRMTIWAIHNTARGERLQDRSDALRKQIWG